MQHLYGDKSRFNSHVGLVGQILTDPSIRFIFVDKMPSSSAAACFIPEQNTVYLPAIDASKLTESEALKVMGLSAHERKHVKLTHHDALKDLSKIIEESKKKNISRGILHNLWQTIEDLRIEMNANYAFPGDLLTIKHVNDLFFEDYKSKPEIMTGNPFGWLMECIRYNTLSLHPAYPRVEFLQVSDELKTYFETAINIMKDGRFSEAIKSGKEATHFTLELALDIEKAWALENKEEQNDKNKKGEGEGSSDITGDGIKELNEKFEKDQGECPVSCNPLSDFINELCEKIAEIEKLEEEEIKKNFKNQSRYIKKEDTYISYGIDDKIVINPPNQISYEQVRNSVGPMISYVRDKIAIQLKTLTDSRTIRGLRRGKLDNSRLYQTQLGNRNVMKKVFPGFEYSTAVQIVVDLSGSMSFGYPLSRSQMSMQMAIVLAEVFQLLKIPFEITGYNTGGTRGNEPQYKGDKKVAFRTEQINFHIFKAFADNYSLAENKYRLGSIHPSGCNIDHEVILWSAARLAKRRETRKLQIVLSDGQPSGGGGTYHGLLDSELKKANKRISASGIQQFAFGLQSKSVEEYYKKYLILEKIEELSSEALKIFVDFLISRMHNSKRG